MRPNNWNEDGPRFDPLTQRQGGGRQWGKGGSAPPVQALNLTLNFIFIDGPSTTRMCLLALSLSLSLSLSISLILLFIFRGFLFPFSFYHSSSFLVFFSVPSPPSVLVCLASRQERQTTPSEKKQPHAHQSLTSSDNQVESRKNRYSQLKLKENRLKKKQ